MKRNPDTDFILIFSAAVQMPDKNVENRRKMIYLNDGL